MCNETHSFSTNFDEVIDEKESRAANEGRNENEVVPSSILPEIKHNNVKACTKISSLFVFFIVTVVSCSLLEGMFVIGAALISNFTDPQKLVAIGGKGGKAFDDLHDVPSHYNSEILQLSRIEIFYTRHAVLAIAPTYLLKNGIEVSRQHGKKDGYSMYGVVEFPKGKRLSRVDIRKGNEKLYQIALWDSHGKRHGPYGHKHSGLHFSFSATRIRKRAAFLAFHGRGGENVDKLGVYVK